MADDAAALAATEHWFLRRGLPHFIDGYHATSDIFTRMLPVLALVFGAEVLGAASLDWTWWQNLAALVAAAALILGTWAAINRARHRPHFQRPDDVGAIELAVFVLVPPLLPVLFGGQLGAAALTAAFNLVLLGLIYFVTSYGLVPMTRWALGQTVRQIGAVLDLFGRALPLLLLFSVALFINTEMWQVAAALDGVLFWSTIAFFVLVGVAFLLVRLPAEVRNLREEVSAEDPVGSCVGTPLEGLVVDGDRGSREDPPMTRRQGTNVLLVLLFSQAVQVLLVTLAITGFFFAFGIIAIRPEVIDTWLGDEIGRGQLLEWTWFGRTIVLTRALIHVSVFLGALSGFYFTVYVITDSTYREEFFTEIVGEVRQSLAVRASYLRLAGRKAD